MDFCERMKFLEISFMARVSFLKSLMLAGNQFVPVPVTTAP